MTPPTLRNDKPRPHGAQEEGSMSPAHVLHSPSRARFSFARLGLGAIQRTKSGVAAVAASGAGLLGSLTGSMKSPKGPPSAPNDLESGATSSTPASRAHLLVDNGLAPKELPGSFGQVPLSPTVQQTLDSRSKSYMQPPSRHDTEQASPGGVSAKSLGAKGLRSLIFGTPSSPSPSAVLRQGTTATTLSSGSYNGGDSPHDEGLVSHNSGPRHAQAEQAHTITNLANSLTSATVLGPLRQMSLFGGVKHPPVQRRVSMPHCLVGYRLMCVCVFGFSSSSCI